MGVKVRATCGLGVPPGAACASRMRRGARDGAPQGVKSQAGPVRDSLRRDVGTRAVRLLPTLRGGGASADGSGFPLWAVGRGRGRRPDCPRGLCTDPGRWWTWAEHRPQARPVKGCVSLSG